MIPVFSRVVRRYVMPSRSAICATSFAVWFPSEGYSTVLPWTARIIARSSRPICDVHLEEPFGRRFLEILRVCRVRNLGIQHDNVFSRGPEGGQRLAVGLTSRDRLSVGPEGERTGPLHRRPLPAFGLRDREGPRPDLAAELGDRLLRLFRIERLAVPAFLVLEERDALALDGAREHGR